MTKKVPPWEETYRVDDAGDVVHDDAFTTNQVAVILYPDGDKEAARVRGLMFAKSPDMVRLLLSTMPELLHPKSEKHERHSRECWRYIYAHYTEPQRHDTSECARIHQVLREIGAFP